MAGPSTAGHEADLERQRRRGGHDAAVQGAQRTQVLLALPENGICQSSPITEAIVVRHNVMSSLTSDDHHRHHSRKISPAARPAYQLIHQYDQDLAPRNPANR